MNWLIAFLTSTVGRKLLIGFTGLFLCFFLVVHLTGNLLLYPGDAFYNEYAHKLHSNEEFLIVAEILLFSAFAIHILVALQISIGTNWTARKNRYAMTQTKRDDRNVNIFGLTPDTTMLVTGIIILGFLITHISDFKLEVWWDMEGLEPADKAKMVLTDLSRIVIYLLGAVAVGIHVSHGLYSACQTVGFNHPKYMPAIKKLSVLFGIVVAVGFGSFPVLSRVLWGN